jgi:hypothetical protein
MKIYLLMTYSERDGGVELAYRRQIHFSKHDALQEASQIPKTSVMMFEYQCSWTSEQVAELAADGDRDI